MHRLAPLDHAGRAIPVPPHHLFSWRTLGLKLLLNLLVWTTILFMVLMVGAAFKAPELEILLRIAPKTGLLSAGLSALVTFCSVVIPELARPWTRRAYGRQLEARIEQMSSAELQQQLKECDLELERTASARERTSLAAWRDWLELKRAERLRELPHRGRLTLRPSRRKLILSTACGAVGMALGLWLILLAIVGGDGGTGIEGFRGPNGVWTKSVIGGLILLVTAVPILEAYTVRVELTADELRKQGWGIRLWSIPVANVSLSLGDDGCWLVADTRTQKRVGELNPHHFDDAELLTLLGRFRSAA
jgi:hypothetical protein